MDQNQTANDDYNDLQKAIDDITQTTKIDPVFSDPIAAPSTVPAGDTGELGEPIGPFPNAQPGGVDPASNPVTPSDTPMQNPNPLPTAPEPTIPGAPTMPPTDFSAPQFAMPESSTSTPQTSDSPTTEPIAQPLEASTPTTPNDAQTPETPMLAPDNLAPEISTPASQSSSDINKIKTAALRDIAPLIGNLQLDPTQKFNLYQDIIRDLDDKTVLGPAYETTRDIADETKRAEALLYLIESIDKM